MRILSISIVENHIKCFEFFLEFLDIVIELVFGEVVFWLDQDLCETRSYTWGLSQYLDIDDVGLK